MTTAAACQEMSKSCASAARALEVQMLYRSLRIYKPISSDCYSNEKGPANADPSVRHIIAAHLPHDLLKRNPRA